MDPSGLTGIDPLTDLLNGVRTSGSVFNQSSVTGAWATRFEDGSPLSLAVLVHGSAWITPEGGTPVRLGPGDVAVLCGGAPYVIADDPGTEPDTVIRAGGRCTTRQGEEPLPARIPDAGAWNTAEPDRTLLINGLYTVDAGTPGRLLAVLPPLALVEASVGTCPVSHSAFEEIIREEPGQQILLDRTMDLMLITALRAWFTRPGSQIPAWYRAHSDPVVAPALRLLHADPARPWTLSTLAARTGVSRAHLARRFNALVGQPPMTYLRQRRLALAADLLCEPGMTLAVVADRVGFANAFALSTAFKKEHGISPSEYRTRAIRAEI
ncbi:cupin domain-containing protein [Streptomyces sp. WI04-05B]|uniref:AraC family transcriptional regulator n=1 Tax=Streptomyces TaxID=1883 RepID=UPI0029BDBF67|nr:MULTISPECIES: AraC family transcriptional regulator [unclassified Streptomyces]MDX2547104.1 AraC family transcriptional regulator [Streptomyces sp. WI04-05B]MDX2581927.1 AraC family transcriptional regulator [Streptomyces sp. WI04-05A]MDX3753648.1 AraC family transcriptional regulator [Streptomyces sp. AK08-02]